MVTLGLRKERENKTQNMLQLKGSCQMQSRLCLKSQKPTEGSHTLGKDENKNIS